MLIDYASYEDIYKIEECGKKCLPIYYKSSDLYFLLKMSDFKVFKVFDNDNNIYGFAVVKINDYSNHIMSIGVDPEFRKLGLGKMLIEKIKNIDSNKEITLNVQKSNEIAIYFYKKCDFIITDVLIDYYENLDCNDAYRMSFK